jgi:hypothetical protein
MEADDARVDSRSMKMVGCAMADGLPDQLKDLWVRWRVDALAGEGVGGWEDGQVDGLVGGCVDWCLSWMGRWWAAGGEG